MLAQTEPCPVSGPELLDKLPHLWAPLKALLTFTDFVTGQIVSLLDTPVIGVLVAIAIIACFSPQLLSVCDRLQKADGRAKKRLDRARQLRDYVITWLPLVLFFSFGIILIHRDFGREWFLTESRPMDQTCRFTLYYPMTAFMIISLGVIIYVCLIWSLFDLDNLHVDDTEMGSFLRRSARILCFVCILLSAVLISRLFYISEPRYSSDPEVSAQAWDQLAELNEGVSTVIFVLFAVIDFFAYKAAIYAVEGQIQSLRELAGSKGLDELSKSKDLKTFIDSEDLDKFAQRKYVEKFVNTKDLGELAWETIWIVDVPCVMGVTFVMCIHRTLHDWMFQNALFTIGLSAGAIAIHVAITQSAFAVLKTRKLLNGIQSEIGE